VLGESFVLIETGALGALGELGLEPGTLGGFGVFGGLSGNLSFLFQNRIVNRSSPGIEVRWIFCFCASPDDNRDRYLPEFLFIHKFAGATAYGYKSN
jgi:hypothetical protein